MFMRPKPSDRLTNTEKQYAVLEAFEEAILQLQKEVAELKNTKPDTPIELKELTQRVDDQDLEIAALEKKIANLNKPAQ